MHLDPSPLSQDFRFIGFDLQKLGPIILHKSVKKLWGNHSMSPALALQPPPRLLIFQARGGPSFGHSLSKPVSLDTALRSAPCH
jgi:hypothetical protein